MSLTPIERSLRSKAAANRSWANTKDRSARTEPARAALFQKFLDECDGDPRRAEKAWTAHFQELSLKSAIKRRKSAELLAEAESAEAELAGLSGGAK